jgi:hypothetical protein
LARRTSKPIQEGLPQALLKSANYRKLFARLVAVVADISTFKNTPLQVTAKTDP